MRWGAALLGSILLGCGGAEHEDVAAEHAAIVGGEPSPAAQDSTVLLVLTADGMNFSACGGVLVAENLVITSRFCVADCVDLPYTCLASGEPEEDGSGAGHVLADYPASQIRVYTGNQRPDFLVDDPDALGEKIIDNGSQTLCSQDFAAILLDRKLDAAISQIRLPDQVAVGEMVSIVGWGTTEGQLVPAQRMTVPSTPVTSVGPLVAEPGATGSLVPRTFTTGPALCFVDEGSPAFSASGALVGIGARSLNYDYSHDPSDPAGPCTVPSVVSVFMQVAGFGDVIDAAFAAAGTEPWLEGGPDPRLAKFGEPCNTDADCQSSICWAASGETSKTCNLDCSPETACPDASLECRDSARGPLCQSPLGNPAPENEPAEEDASCAVRLQRLPRAPFSMGSFLLALAFALRWRAARRNGARPDTLNTSARTR